jgi:hypothetical protein
VIDRRKRVMSKGDVFDNTKDALAYILREHGVDVLLGDLKNYLMDYAPKVTVLRKNIISFVHPSGAGRILKRALAVGDAEREIATRNAMDKIVDSYGIERSLAESVILEFASVLGWRVTPQIPPPTQPKPVIRPAQPTQGTAKATIGDKTWDVVEFGRFRGKPIEWIVLERNPNCQLLLAKGIIEKRRYHSELEVTTWATCELRAYLNGPFLQKFSADERGKIGQSINENADNPWYGTAGGATTTDRVFLLSIDEVVRYFGDSGDLNERKGWYYGKGGYALNDGKGYLIYDFYSDARVAKIGNSACWWWLRSPGDIGHDAAGVDVLGDLDIVGNIVSSAGGGVRPALWLNL